MVELMARMYGRLVIFKYMKIEDVPEQYRELTQKWIDAQPDWYKSGLY